MKIGLLTFHNAHNYGAVLQAYALRTVLRKLGHEAVILNYRNEAIEKHYPKKLDTEDAKKQEDWQRQYQRFEEFINQVLLEEKTELLQMEDLEKTAIDCFICGSDQIWESGLTGGMDPVFFLDFNCTAKKVSYAASKGCARISQKEEQYFKDCLSDFVGVSTREAGFAKELNRIGIAVCDVLDPTMLLEAEDYKLWPEENENAEEKYILVYYIVEDEILTRCSKEAEYVLGLKVKGIHFYRVEDSENQMADCGPKEFISLFRNAEYILTNSFHGMIFSVIFRKSFYAVYEKDSRKDNLLKKLGLTDRHIRRDGGLLFNKIDYTETVRLLENEKERSLDFLRSVLRRTV